MEIPSEEPLLSLPEEEDDPSLAAAVARNLSAHTSVAAHPSSGSYVILGTALVPASPEPATSVSSGSPPEKGKTVSEIVLSEPVHDPPQVYPAIHQLVFAADYWAIKRGLRNGVYKAEDLKLETKGNTALFLAVMLCGPEEEDVRRYRIVDLFLRKGGDPLQKNAEGWSLLDVAAAVKNEHIIRRIYESVRIAKLRIWKAKRDVLYDHLAKIPDFYMEIKWDFRSSVIPFVSFFTPSDTFRVWKMGSSVRLDFSFLGFNEDKPVTSDTSILLREGYLVEDAFRKFDLVILDRSHRELVNPLQTPEGEERDEVVKKIMESQPIQGDLTIPSFSWSPSRSFFGYDKVKRIHGRVAKKFRLVLDTVVTARALENVGVSKTYEEYLASQSRTEKKETGITKQVSCGLWTSHEFPLQFAQVLTVIRTLAKNNGSFRQLKDYLSGPEIQRIIENDGFPVRIQVPMGYTIYAVVTFTVFKRLNPETDNYREIFTVPQDYTLVSRKNAFRCMGKNKSTIIANLNI